MVNKVPSNFSEYLSNIWRDNFQLEANEIINLLSHEFYGILKQISMIAKNYNSAIEFENISSGFSQVISNSPSEISNMITGQYNFCYQEFYSKIIKDGDYALKPNRYQASSDRIKLLEETLERYRDNLAMVDRKMNETFHNQSNNFVTNSLVSNLLKCLEEEFFELPCKQNKDAYNECYKLLDKTKNAIVSNLSEICINHTDKLNNKVAGYLENRILVEKGNTYSSDDLKQAKEAFVSSRVSAR